MSLWPYIWFFAACLSSYLGLPWLSPLLSMIFLLFLWFSYENNKIKRERKEYDRLHPKEAEAERKKLEYLKIKWAKEEKKANELAIWKRLD